MSSNVNDLPLPYGWVKQTHESGHPYYVDTRANPPRSIWTHPYDDEQYLNEHPDAREKVRPVSSMGKPQPPSSEKERRHSYDGQAGSSTAPSTSQSSSSSMSASQRQKRGFFGKLKDKAIGTKEEREAEKIRMAQLQEQRRQQRLAQQQAYAQYAQQQAIANQQRYGHPQYGYGYGNTQYAPQAQRTGGGFGGGGLALPLLGGVAGGLLLGEVLDGGFDGGGFDGGGFDDGFGGGGF